MPDLNHTLPVPHHTAAPILARFPHVRRLTLPVHEFTFLCPDRCRDTTHHDRKSMVEAYWRRDDPEYVDGVDAESFAQFRARVRASLVEIAALECGSVLVVSHGQVMQLVRAAVATGSLDAVAMST